MSFVWRTIKRLAIMLLMLMIFGVSSLAQSIDKVAAKEITWSVAIKQSIASSIDAGYSSFLHNVGSIPVLFAQKQIGTMIIFNIFPAVITWLFTLLWVSIILDIADMNRADTISFPIKVFASTVVTFGISAFMTLI